MRILRTHELMKTYNKKKVVDRVSIEVKQGEIVGLLGPNGAGKTTTFYMTTGFIAPDAGHVYFEEDGALQDITHLPMYRRARLGIGYLPQEASIFRKLTVEENLMAILELTPLTKQEREKRLHDLLKEFNIARLAKQKAYTLSGGERRRVEIARALTTQPAFMLLDEPFVGIDPITVGDLKTMISALKERGIGILITDHNVRETLPIIERAYLMFDGKILVEGNSKQLLDDPKARELYLGHDFKI